MNPTLLIKIFWQLKTDTRLITMMSQPNNFDVFVVVRVVVVNIVVVVFIFLAVFIGLI